MQPLISVDHESRHGHREDAEAVASEDTPLLRERFPPPGRSQGRDLVTSAVVTGLLMVLAAGVAIGLYLLVQQSDAENILPPVEEALRLVSRRQWAPGAGAPPVEAGVPPVETAARAARRVLAVQTDSETCRGTLACASLLQALQVDAGGGELPYNFVISSDGQTFEVLGWRRRSPAYPEGSHSLVLGFIGNFTETTPSDKQMKAAKMFLDESVSHKYLQPLFEIVGKNTRHSPKQLFQQLTGLKQWNQELSDC